MPGPVRAASSSVARPMSAAVGMTPERGRDEDQHRVGVCELEHDRDGDERHEQVRPAGTAQQEAPQVEASARSAPARPCGGGGYPGREAVTLASSHMGPRIVLHTGKGGVGKTSVAAATARRAAASGARTLVLLHRPGAFAPTCSARRSGDEPTPVGDGLWAEQVQAQAELERNWTAVRSWLSAQLLRRGADRISAEELTVPPGLDELLALLRLRRHADSDEFDVVVVDCAPTGETLRLLSLPDVARWWLDRVVPAQERGALDAARPFARAVLDVALPGDDVLADVTGARARRAGDERRAARRRARLGAARHDARSASRSTKRAGRSRT